MAESALKGVFEEVTLTYEVQGEASGTDDYGNPVFGATTHTLQAVLEVTNSRALTERFGADALTLVFDGTLTKPAVMPNDVKPGASFALTWRGQEGTLKLEQVRPRKLRDVDEALGQRFFATFRPD